MRTVLLTGPTGFIGGATAAHLLTAGEDLRLLLLVRAPSQEAARARIAASLGRFLDAAVLEVALKRVEPLVGDLLDVATLDDRRLDAVTHVLHLAASTSFRSVYGVRRTNILGALALAHRARRLPHLARYVHVSTAFACGVAADRVVGEDTPLSPAGNHLVEYTRSKAECELLLRATAPELPLVVARPSVVLGHTVLGCAPSSSIYWYYRALHALGRAPFPRGADTLQDAVPVDWAAQALSTLLFKPALRESVYHLSSGVDWSDPWSDVAAVLDRCFGAPAAMGPPVAQVEPADVERVFGPGDAAGLANAIRLFDRFSALSTECFDHRRILAEGVPPPPRLTSYLARCTEASRGRTVYQELDGEA